MNPLVSSILLYTICTILMSAGLVAAAAGADDTVATPPPGALKPPAMCEIGGPQLKLDANDATNKLMHFKGTVWFRPLFSLQGVNLRFKAGGRLCTCVTCPNGSSHATGLKPAGKIRKNEVRSYTIDCAQPLTFFPVPFPLGKGEIDYFVQTQPSGAGVFSKATCTGTFSLYPPDG
jgi:hypothetical protein